ncbi:S-formylglutathione hydrolase [Fodinicurvata halophila]|uniref:S-formylglutathione hydrolase n=1 Tax=Fodinicurvata halophila TaxID=1419723 RepID=A0ABV8UMA6_9PROT
MTVETRASSRCFGGEVHYCSHHARATGTEMRFSIYLPPGDGPFPVLVWLSGLTCTEENFTTKAGAYRKAAELGLMVVAPDTSPRGEDVADADSYDLGQGAGFYVDATEEPWAPHFRMYSYVTRDLPAVLKSDFPARQGPMGLSGHSMGGHGALTLALHHPELFASVSAFAPIVSPTRCPWGEKALSAYLGAESKTWEKHDASLLMASGTAAGHFDDILVDQGTADGFLEEQLRPELLEEAARQGGQKLTLRRQDGYDHSYFFITSFIEEHLAFHAERLR